MENKDIIYKDEIFEYSFYDESKKITVVLNKENLKKIFKADHILLEEIEHK
jgi:hypothetical protein